MGDIGGRGWLDQMSLELFSNLNDLMILCESEHAFTTQTVIKNVLRYSVGQKSVESSDEGAMIITMSEMAWLQDEI